MNAIEIRGLCKSYGTFSLDRLDLTLPCGCIMGLIGENGAGKTTIIKLILDMINRDGGSIFLFGEDNRKNIRLMKEDIGAVPDEIGLPACLTVAQIGKAMKNTFKNWDGDAFSEYLKKLSVPAEQSFGKLSKGTKMKLGIALALSHNAKVYHSGKCGTERRISI